MGLEVLMTTNVEEYKQSENLKLNYSTSKICTHEIQVIPHTLLSETDIKAQTIEVKQWQNLPLFFTNTHPHFPFDIFAASFYLLSRYEEYLPYTPDIHNRFPHTASIAYTHHFLDKPLIDNWIIIFKNYCLQIFPTIQFKQHKFSFEPTYDIDIAYCYLYKGFYKTVGGIVRDIFLFRFNEVIKRIQVLISQKNDPYDSYHFIESLHATYHLKGIYFILMASGTRFDKNITSSHPAFSALIQRLQKNNLIGIHPSYYTQEDPKKINNEIKELEKVLEHKIHTSRQHYIKNKLPQVYETLLSAGITDDYSMGYGSINGFRASTCFPFLWFNLSKNEITTLQIHPFSYMECNSRFEQKNTPLEAMKEMQYYYQQCYNMNGVFSSIWHNFSLGIHPQWLQWHGVYNHFLETYFQKQ